MSARGDMDELHVLLVDDEESYLRTAAKIFKRNGIETVICSDGRNVPVLGAGSEMSGRGPGSEASRWTDSMFCVN